MSRYQAGTDDEFEPGSGGRVLRNRLGIVDPERAGLVETVLLMELYRRVVPRVKPTFVIDSKAILTLHRDWLQAIYPFAGKLRTINVRRRRSFCAGCLPAPGAGGTRHDVQAADALHRL